MSNVSCCNRRCCAWNASDSDVASFTCKLSWLNGKIINRFVLLFGVITTSMTEWQYKCVCNSTDRMSWTCNFKMGHKQLAPTQETTMTHNLEMELHPIAPMQDNIAENSNHQTPLEASPVGLVLPRKGARIPLCLLHPPDTPVGTPVRSINSTGDHRACTRQSSTGRTCECIRWFQRSYWWKMWWSTSITNNSRKMSAWWEQVHDDSFCHPFALCTAFSKLVTFAL